MIQWHQVVGPVGLFYALVAHTSPWKISYRLKWQECYARSVGDINQECELFLG